MFAMKRVPSWRFGFLNKFALCGVVGTAAAMAPVVGVAADQPFPWKPLRIIVPFPAGGSYDVVARVVAQRMQLGQNVLVDDRPGGGTVIGVEMAARAPGDGHTLLATGPSFVTLHALRSNLPFDTDKDFKPVGLAIELPMVWAVNLSLPAKNMKEYIALARARPGAISYGTAGAGTIHNMLGEALKLAAKVDITHVPFPGEPPAVTAAVGGHVTGVLVNITSTAPFINAGKLRGLAVTSATRDTLIPEVPTAREAGAPEIEATNWNGYFVPAATPSAAITRLNVELNRVLNIPEVRDNLRAQGLRAAPGSAEQFAALLKAEGARYGKIIKEANIKID